jgi:hypothetical protein
MIDENSFSRKDPEQSPVFLRIQVVPNSRENAISDVLEDGTLKVHIKSPPIEGKANRSILDLLSKFFDWPKSRIKIVQGEKSRRKLIVFEGMKWMTVQAVLNKKTNRL